MKSLKPSIKFKRTTLFLIPLVLGCFGLLPVTQAVLPAPDGGYPGGNTAEGQNALLSLTTGTNNTAVGWFSLRTVTTGQYNTAIGAGALPVNTASLNTATGAAALFRNTGGANNTANGFAALFSNTTGSFNTATGESALFSNIGGNDNTAVGRLALAGNQSSQNTAIGSGALISVNSGFGGLNTAVGFHALYNTTGYDNTAIGADALSNNTTGQQNIALGAAAGSNVTTAYNVICIGQHIPGANVHDSCFIASIRGVTTINNDAIPVMIDSASQLGTVSSSRRFKKEIKPMEQASEAVLALKPVTFHYKSDKTNRPEFGLIAEQVAEVNPDLVVRDKNGEIYTVRYDAVNAMLLNEFLKAHRTVEEQQATITQLKKDFQMTSAEQQKEVQRLAAAVRQQSAQIQKVSAQIETRKPASKIVFNHQ